VKTLSVEIQPAAAREMRVPASVMSTAPASGAKRHSQAPVTFTRYQPDEMRGRWRALAAQLRELVDVEREASPVQCDYEA